MIKIDEPPTTNKLLVRWMNLDEIQSFDIEQYGRSNCHFNQSRFYVKKQKEADGEWIRKRNFYASLDEQFEIQDNNSLKSRFKNQLGYISCTLGFIYQVSVNDSPDCAHEMSTLLTSLCLIDPELSYNDNLNYALNKLESDDAMEFAADHCSRFVGVNMSEKKKKKGTAYISAAVGSGYTKILIKGEKDEGYVLIDLNIAEREYNITTGSFKNIDPSWNQWVFCKD